MNLSPNLSRVGKPYAALPEWQQVQLGKLNRAQLNEA
jgi:hypothetical protein